MNFLPLADIAIPVQVIRACSNDRGLDQALQVSYRLDTRHCRDGPTQSKDRRHLDPRLFAEITLTTHRIVEQGNLDTSLSRYD